MLNHHRPITALVVSPDELFRLGLRMLLRNMTPVRHVVEAAGADEAMRLTRAAGYDVAVVDTFYARGTRPADVIRALGVIQPDAPLVLYADADADASELCPGEITCAVSYRGPHSASHLCHAVQRLLSARANGAAAVPSGQAGERAADAVAGLTAKEREVLAQVTSGSSSKAIARSMHVSLRTVESHRARICAKLGVRTVPELTKLALRAGLTSLDSE